MYSQSSVDIREFPKIPDSCGVSEFDGFRELTAELTEFNSNVWKAKKDLGISLKSEIDGISVPINLAVFEQALREMHNLVQ